MLFVPQGQKGRFWRTVSSGYKCIVSYVCRVYSDNSSRSVANEILSIESKDVRHAMNTHRRHNTSIVYLDA